MKRSLNSHSSILMFKAFIRGFFFPLVVELKKLWIEFHTRPRGGQRTWNSRSFNVQTGETFVEYDGGTGRRCLMLSRTEIGDTQGKGLTGACARAWRFSATNSIERIFNFHLQWQFSYRRFSTLCRKAQNSLHTAAAITEPLFGLDLDSHVNRFLVSSEDEICKKVCARSDVGKENEIEKSR